MPNVLTFREREPQIWDAIRFGCAGKRCCRSITEAGFNNNNIKRIPGRVSCGNIRIFDSRVAGHPKVVISTADAFR